MNLAELTCTTRLLLVTILGTRHLCDGLAIRDACRLKLDSQLLVVLQSPLQCAEVEFALTAYDGLTKLLALLHHPCGVFLMHTEEGCHKLLCLCCVLSLDGT